MFSKLCNAVSRFALSPTMQREQSVDAGHQEDEVFFNGVFSVREQWSTLPCLEISSLESQIQSALSGPDLGFQRLVAWEGKTVSLPLTFRYLLIVFRTRICFRSTIAAVNFYPNFNFLETCP